MSGFKSRLVTFFAVLLGLLAIGLLSTPAAHARDWLVPSQAPTIQAAVDSAISGDVVVLGPGTYTDCTNLNSNNVAHIAILRNGIDIRGETGNPDHVILDAGWQGRVLEMRGFADTTRVTGVTFRRGKASNPFGSGGGAFAYDAKPYFKDCVFDSCSAEFAGGGINVLAGELTVENCVFVDCSTDNIGAGIRTSTTPLTITSTTFFRSHGPSLQYANEAPVISQTIFTGGDAPPIARNNSGDPVPEITCTNIWDNEEDWTGFLTAMADVDGNLSIDPLFCNPFFGDLSLYSVSNCAPEFNPDCGLIGARPVVCGLGSATYVIEPDGTGDFPTIQAALNAVATADTIALADGTFTGVGNRDLDTLGKGVVVRGLNRDPDLAIIDCGGSALEPHRGFHIFRGENSFMVVRDLTITNADVADDGAAMLIENSSPRIINVTFVANHAAMGAAVYANGGDPEISACEIVANEGRNFAGGFAFDNSDATITDCLFRNNWGARASALFMPDSCRVTVTGTTFNANNSSGDRACIEVEGKTFLTLNNCLITNGNRSSVRCFGNASATASNTNIHNNAEGDWVDCLASQGFSAGNTSSDPLYCDLAGLDFTVRSDSECAPYNAANNERIGAFDVACYGDDSFTDMSSGLPQVALRSKGVSWVDFNGDGLLDIHVVNPEARNEALLGSGIGMFNDLGDSLANYSGPSVSAAWADFDNDGDTDVYYSNRDLASVLAGNQDGQFTDLENADVADSGAIRGSSWADYNRDGRLDLLVVHDDSTCVLYEQMSTGEFQDISEVLGLTFTGSWMGSSWVDYDGDGRRDLYLLNDDGANKLVRNTDTGFEATSSPLAENIGKASSAAWGDYNNDNKMDLLLTNTGTRSKLLRYAGAGAFTDVASGPIAEIGQSASGIWGDYDNDGDLDIFLTNTGTRDKLIRNEGANKFVDLGELVFSAPDSSTGAAWGDYDNDGDLDLVVADQGGATRVYRNDYAGTNHWLKVQTKGLNNAGAVAGTQVKVIVTDGTNQRRELGAGGGHYSADAMIAHFGLGDVALIDTLKVVWPWGGSKILTDVTADQLVVVEHAATAVSEDDIADGVPRLTTGLRSIAPNPFNPATQVRFDLAQRGEVRVRVYDVAGRLVAEPLHKVMPAGSHRVLWRGRDRADRTVAAGVYFVQLQAGGQVWTQGAVLVK